MKRKTSNSLAPGFRFHPTDEELVWYYLKRKISGKSLRFDPITEIDIYKSEPWDLPGNFISKFYICNLILMISIYNHPSLSMLTLLADMNELVN